MDQGIELGFAGANGYLPLKHRNTEKAKPI
jgi:hypothetical protein